MSYDTLKLLTLGVALLYALVRGLADCQRKHRVWGAIGLACAAACFIALVVPIPPAAQ